MNLPVWPNINQKITQVLDAACNPLVGVNMTTPPIHILGGYSNIDISDKINLKGAQAYANLYINKNMNGKRGKTKNFVLYKVKSAKKQVVAGMNYAIIFIVKKPNCVIKGKYLCGQT